MPHNAKSLDGLVEVAGRSSPCLCRGLNLVVMAMVPPSLLLAAALSLYDSEI